MAGHNEIGKIGENIAATFLERQGFSILHRNYRTKFGEIDIVIKKDKSLHFVEVKSVKVRSFDDLKALHVKPEDNITGKKWKNIVTSSEIYLKNMDVPHETRWKIDLVCVYVDTEIRQGKVVFMENIYKNK